MLIAVLNTGLCPEQLRSALALLASDFPFSAREFMDIEWVESTEVPALELHEEHLLYNPSYVRALSDEMLECELMRAAGMEEIFRQSKSRILMSHARAHGIDVLYLGCVAASPGDFLGIPRFG